MTNDFERIKRRLKNSYVFFIITVLAVILVGNTLIEKKVFASDDISLIVSAREHRFKSHNITLLAYKISNLVQQESKLEEKYLDSLNTLLKEFEEGHKKLLENSKKLEFTANSRETSVKDQIRIIDINYKKIKNTTSVFFEPDIDRLKVTKATETIDETNKKLQTAVKFILSATRAKAISRYGVVKRIMFWAPFIAIVITIIGYLFVFLPVMKKLNVSSNLMEETSERLSLATKAGNIGIWEYDVLSDTLIWDETMYAMYNMPYKQGGETNMIRRWMASIHSNDVRRIKKELYQSLKSGIPIDTEFTVLWKDNSEHHIQAKAVANFDKKGKVITLTGTNLDLTGLRTAEGELQKANTELQALLDSGNYVSTISTDLEGNITLFSKGAETLLGYTAEEMVNKQSPAIIHIEEEVIQRGNELSEQFGREIRGFDVFTEYAKQGGYESKEWTYKRKDGSTFPVQLVVTGIRNSEGELTGFLGIGTDISWQKEKEKELQTTINIVGEQNKRLLNFAYIVSHNLRSHSGNIEMLLGIIETAEDDEERNEMLAHLRGISNNLSETIKHLNDVVYINTNPSIKKEKINLKKYADDTIETLSGALKAQKGKIVNNIPADIEVEFNAAYMESVMINFLSNGLKYQHPDRDVKVLLDIEFENDKPILQISDNGLGIDLEKYGKKLFGMYKTFHGNADAKGIGLFITKNQVEAMGGTIEVESEINKGTTFKIYFDRVL